jgi:hypothetical protein
VKEDWRDKPNLLREYGYENNSQNDWQAVFKLCVISYLCNSAVA